MASTVKPLTPDEKLVWAAAFAAFFQDVTSRTTGTPGERAYQSVRAADAAVLALRRYSTGGSFTLS